MAARTAIDACAKADFIAGDCRGMMVQSAVASIGLRIHAREKDVESEDTA